MTSLRMSETPSRNIGIHHLYDLSFLDPHMYRVFQILKHRAFEDRLDHFNLPMSDEC